jgi:signal transduction histidine kinase
VTDTVADLESLALSRHVSIEPTLAPAVVQGDRDRIREAIANLLANAVQYNKDGGSVSLSLSAADDRATLEIADTGIGIGEQDMAKVFEPFFRADPARSRDVGGAGLGLAVTRTIVERHGGAIACRSEPGRGTTMTVVLPVATGEPASRRGEDG